MNRGFEKISFEQFSKDVADDIELYNSYLMPVRKTANSAGYDLCLLNDLTIKVNEIVKIPTGLKAYYKSDEALLLIIRSSSGFKYNLRLCNQVGVIDSDYYNNPDNEGHMWLAVQNEGSKDITIKKGDAIAQAIFTKYLVTDDDNNSVTRIGGVGSTGGAHNEKF